MKPGYKTTEFWVTIATAGWAAFSGLLSPEMTALVVGGVVGLYTVARAVVKYTATKADDAILAAIDPFIESIDGDDAE